MQDRPDAHELAAAVARFLMEEVRPAVPPHLRFGVLVAANACAILARETGPSLEAWTDARSQEFQAMQDLLGDDVLTGFLRGEPDEDAGRTVQRWAAAAIRAGDLDARWDEAVAVLRDSVRAKLAVAHPGYDAFADDGRE